MPPAFVAVILLSLLSVATTLIAVLLAYRMRGGATIAAGIGFSTGIMILISLLELIPEANALAGLGATAAAVALGAGFLWLANLIIPHTHLVREHGAVDARLVKSVYLVVFGLILHDVPEGFAMANAYVADPSLGVLVGIAIALHNLPEELAMAIPAMAFKSPRFLVVAAVLSALAEPLGAVLGLFAVHAQPGLNGWFMAFAAGAMLFISFDELVPMARRYHRPVAFAGGFLASIVVHRLLARAIAAAA